MSENELIDILLGGSIILVIFLFVFIIAYLVIYIISFIKLFQKAGKKGWEAIVPFYNSYVLIEIAGLNWWYFLITMSGTILTMIGLASISWIASLTGWLVNFFVFYNLAKKMHKEPIGIAIGGALVPGIMVLILGLSKNYQYDSSVVVSPNGPIEDNKSNTNNNTATPERFCLGCGQKLNQNVSFCENCGKKVD